jgi:CRISPR system Cascade subunit CasE
VIYLSKLTLNPRDRQVQAELRDPYQLHRTLAKAFGADKAQWESARVLFRVEDEGQHPYVLVQSRVEPNWDMLSVPERYLMPGEGHKTKSVNLAFTKGQSLIFRLRANPTVCHEGKRQGLYLEEERLAWIERKAADGGFALTSVRVRQEGREVAKHKGEEAPRSIRQVHCRLGATSASFSAARFDGTLRVVDPVKFTAAIENGIGSAKGFGFGLLSVARC